MKKREVKNHVCREHVNLMTTDPLAYRDNHAYKDGNLYVLFTGQVRADEGTTWLIVHDQPSELSILCLQIIHTYHTEAVKKSQYQKQLIKILSIEPELSANRLASMVHQPVSWIKSMLSIDEKINLLTMPLASAYSLSKWPNAPDDLMDKAMRMKPSEFIPIFHNRLKEFRVAQREGKKRA